jgi:hypothetical protein
MKWGQTAVTGCGDVGSRLGLQLNAAGWNGLWPASQRRYCQRNY